MADQRGCRICGSSDITPGAYKNRNYICRVCVRAEVRPKKVRPPKGPPRYPSLTTGPGYLSARTQAEFWRRVEIRHPQVCWPWTGSTQKRGYGRVLLRAPRDSEQTHSTSAPRIMWRLTRGPIPKGHGVFHHCDNARCVNPAHLFTGTHDDNMQDMWRKRRARGWKAPRKATP